jgi:hypothetical protein
LGVENNQNSITSQGVVATEKKTGPATNEVRLDNGCALQEFEIFFTYVLNVHLSDLSVGPSAGGEHRKSKKTNTVDGT